MINLLKLVRDNAARANALRAEASGAEAHVYVYGVIGAYWGDVSAQMLADKLATLDVETVHLHVNSPGGDVFEARAMMSAIAAHKARFIAHVEGLAASAASDLIMACDEVEITQGGFVMIHNAWTITMGNKSDMRECGELLQKIDDAIVDDYRKRTKKDADQLRQWMDATTWFSADDAKTHGFVDRVVEVVPGAGESDEDKSASGHWNLSAYGDLPQALKGQPPKPKQDNDEERQALHAASRARRLRLLERSAA